MLTLVDKEVLINVLVSHSAKLKLNEKKWPFKDNITRFTLELLCFEQI